MKFLVRQGSFIALKKNNLIQVRTSKMFNTLPFVSKSHFSTQPKTQLNPQSQSIHETSSTQPTQQKPKHFFEPYPIQKYEVGQRLDRYLKNTKLNWISAQRHLRNKQIYILTKQNTKIRTNDYRLQQGDTLYIKSIIAEEMYSEKPQLPYNIPYEEAKKLLEKFMIFDNKNLTILNKPAGYSVQGGDDYDKNLFSIMAAKYKRQMIHVIHRLDKPTSGILFFCKNLRTAQLIQRAIQSRKEYNKYYLALSVGEKIKQEEEYIRCNIQWTNRHKARIIDSLQKESSKDSITYYKRLYSKQLNLTGKSLNLLGMKLITGRKHQIRCHLTDYLMNPILNDRKYGAILVKNNDKIIGKVQPTSDDSTEKLKVKDQEGHIFLHALMTTIKSDEIVKEVFQVPLQNLLKSRKSPSAQILEASLNGAVFLKNGQIKIVGNLPEHWSKISSQPHQASNNPNIKQLFLDHELNQIQIAEQIQTSQSNLWKRHRPQKKVMTIQ